MLFLHMPIWPQIALAAVAIRQVNGGGCPPIEWIPGKKCENADRTVCSCQKDNAAFVDVWGYSCSDWVGANCLTADVVYNYPDKVNLEANCPKACAICSTQVRWLQSYTCGSNVQCQDGTCNDNAAFVDVWGYSCSDWVGANCLTSDVVYGYPDKVNLEANCPKACAICSCKPPWKSCFDKTKDPIVNDTAYLRSLRDPNAPLAQKSPFKQDVQDHFSALLMRSLWIHFASELLGYRFEPHNDEKLQKPIVSRDLDIALEVWDKGWPFGTSKPGQDPAMKSFVEMFDMGYGGKRGLYFAGVRFKSCLSLQQGCTETCAPLGKCADASKSFEYYSTHMSSAALDVFPRLGTYAQNMTQGPTWTGNYPMKSIYFGGKWNATTGFFEGGSFKPMYLPEHCSSPGSAPCMEMLGADQNFHRESYGSQLHHVINSTKFPYALLLLGQSHIRTIVEERVAAGIGSVFWWYWPEPFALKLKAKEIAFPFSTTDCGNPGVGFGFSIGCQKAGKALKIVVGKRLKLAAPELYNAVRTTFRLQTLDVDDLMGRHKKGGGTFDGPEGMNESSCAWMKDNMVLVRKWLPLQCKNGTDGSVPMVPFILADGNLDCCEGEVVIDKNNKTKCVPTCKPGEVPDAFARVCRRNCPAGSVLDTPSGRCEACAAGRSWKSKLDPLFTGIVAECEICQPGEYRQGNYSSMPKCELCVAGKVSNESAAQCTACPKGQFAVKLEKKCTPCRAGTFTDVEGSTECTSCPRGKFQPDTKTGSAQCLACPADFTTRWPGATKLPDCQCDVGSYNRSTDACIRCSEAFPEASVECDGFGKRPKLLPGFMTLSGSSLVYSCAQPAALLSCTGSVSVGDENCAAHSTGVACALCEDGHRWSFDLGVCVACKGHGLVVLIVCLFFACLLLLRKFRPSENTVGSLTVEKFLHRTFLWQPLTQVLDVYQFMGTLESSSMSWDHTTNMVLKSCAGIFSFTYLECIIGDLGVSGKRRAIGQVLLINVAPAFVICLAALSVLPFMVSRKARRCLFPSPARAFNEVVELLSTFFTSVLSAAINLVFARYEHKGLSVKSLIAFPYLLSGDSVVDELQVIAVISILLWCVGYIVLQICLVVLVEKGTDHPFVREGTIAMVTKYRLRCTWFSLELLAVKASFVLTPVLSDEPDIQLQWLSAVLISHALIVSFVKPFRFSRHTFGEVVCVVFKLAISLVGMSNFGAMKENRKTGIVVVIALSAWSFFYLVWGLVDYCRGEALHLRRPNFLMEKLRNNVRNIFPGQSLGVYMGDGSGKISITPEDMGQMNPAERMRSLEELRMSVLSHPAERPSVRASTLSSAPRPSTGVDPTTADGMEQNGRKVEPKATEEEVEREGHARLPRARAQVPQSRAWGEKQGQGYATNAYAVASGGVEKDMKALEDNEARTQE